MAVKTERGGHSWLICERAYSSSSSSNNNNNNNNNYYYYYYYYNYWPISSGPPV